MTNEVKKKLEKEKRKMEETKPELKVKLALVFEKGQSYSRVPEELKTQAKIEKFNGKTFLFFEGTDLKNGFCIPKKLESHVKFVLFQPKSCFNKEDKTILYYSRFVNQKMSPLSVEHIDKTDEDFIIVEPESSIIYTDILAWNVGYDIKMIQIGVTQIFEFGEADDGICNFYCYRSFFSVGEQQEKVEKLYCFNAEIKNLFEHRNDNIF